MPFKFKFKFKKVDILIGLLLTGIFLLGFFVSYLVIRVAKIPLTKATPVPTEAPVQTQVEFPPAPEISKQKGVYNTVFLGYGGVGHEGSLLTDSIIVLHIDTNTKKAALISIPRDLYVTGNRKINAEAAANGFQNEGGVIKNVTGLPVDYFVAVDFGGFIKLIDDLGGITVNVPKTFDDPFYPITGAENDTCGKTADEIAALKAKYSDYQLETQFTCRYEHLHFDKGPANLDGTTALKFVRSRHGDSDFGRSERQFAVLKGILQKLVSLNALTKSSSIIQTLLKIVKTNLDMNGIGSLLDVIGPTGDYKINDIHLTTANVLAEGKSSAGAYILYPKSGMFDFQSIKDFINGSINQ